MLGCEAIKLVIINLGIRSMNFTKQALSVAAILAIVACGESANGQTEGNDDAGFTAISGTYTAEAKHRYITFSYSHGGYSNPWLRWREWDADLNWNADDPASSSVNVTIDATSIDTGVDVFDGHLKGERFFDVENHPQITFVSTSLEQTSDNTGKMIGDLTIKGITKPVELDVVFRKDGFDTRKSLYKLGFSASANVLRSDFDVDFLAPSVSDEVVITIEAEFILPAEEE